MFNYFLFDLDGTILDTNETIFRSFEYTLKFHLNYTLKLEELMKVFGEPLLKQMTHFNKELAEPMCNTYRNYYATHALEFTKTFSGVEETLNILKTKNIQIGIITNKTRIPAVQALKAFNLFQYFDLIIGGDEVKNTKPHPEALLKGMELMKANPKETLMIGDSPLDMEAALRARIKKALVGWNIFPDERFDLTPPDFYLNQMNDLLKILETNVA
ncbi:MAG: HAD-IA family hydrolase [Halanaerobiales bacterium]|nr:HAD-IA family hydrolase [Halanaerobiales bacterium]